MVEKRKVRFITLGCKANQYDTTAFLDQVSDKVDVVDGKADFYVINTCTVTSRADRDARKWIYRARRENPDGIILVTGCSVQTQNSAYLNLPVDYVVGNSHKEEVPSLIVHGKREESPRLLWGELKKERMSFLPFVERYAGGSRAFVKIQEGCDYTCTFCLTRLARGKHRSVPLSLLVEQIQNLHEQGFQEVVLTGIQIGQYGKDLTPPVRLWKALSYILKKSSIKRIRLTSIDPREVDENLIQLVKEERRICPHLHIPAQSGNDRILKAMGRGYTRRFLESLYEKIKEEIPDLLLGSDIIVGFPGEDPSAFNDTLTLVERYIDHLHPFPYSDRPGVRSSGMKPKVPQEVIHRRMEVIRKLGEKKKRDFARSLLGRSAEVLVETTQENGRFFGYTEHYVGVFVEGGRPGTLLPVILQEKNGEIIGVPISSEERGKVLCG